jgi:hypothetical protein
MERRFGILRVIGSIYKVLGIIAGVLTILAALAICVTSIVGGAALGNWANTFGTPSTSGFFSSIFGGIVVGIGIVLYGGAITITLYGIGEGVYLLLALEENTRATTLLLQKGNEPETQD